MHCPAFEFEHDPPRGRMREWYRQGCRKPDQGLACCKNWATDAAQPQRGRSGLVFGIHPCFPGRRRVAQPAEAGVRMDVRAGENVVEPRGLS